MTFSNAILNYPWEGVTLVASDPKNPEDIYVLKRCKNKDGEIENVILSTETAEEVYGDNNVISANKQFGNGCIPEKAKEDNTAIDKLLAMENWNWRPVRSLTSIWNF